jgi:hypothetical protein
VSDADDRIDALAWAIRAHTLRLNDAIARAVSLGLTVEIGVDKVDGRPVVVPVILERPIVRHTDSQP